LEDLSFATGVLLFLVRDKIVEGPLLEKFSEIFLTTKLNYGTKNIHRMIKLIENLRFKD
jgi:hypothetical protein